jgi:hypothetical protein
MRLAIAWRASFFRSSCARRCSSVVEQRYRKPQVVGSTPTIGSRVLRGKTGVFYKTPTFPKVTKWTEVLSTFVIPS